jgi:replicative DNA helicase
MSVTELAHDLRSEAMVILACVNHESAVPVAVDELAAEHFHDPRLGACFESIQKLFAAGEPVRIASVTKQLELDGLLPKIGGVNFFASLEAERVPPTELPYWAQQIRNAYCRRRYHQLGEEIQQLSVQGSEPDEIEGQIASQLDGIREVRGQKRVSIKDQMREIFEEINGKRDPKRQVATGFYALDDLLQGGFLAGQLIVVAGRTSHGKSALGNRLALEAMRSGYVHIVSTEIASDELLRNLLTIHSRVPRHRLRAGASRVTEQMKERMLESARFITSDRLSIADPSQVCDIGRIMAQAHQIAGRHGQLGLLLVDYIQNVRGVEYRNSRSREQEVAEVSMKLKHLALQLECPVVALSQLNRQIESRDKKVPTTADIRESDAIAHDADTIIVIDRPEARLRDETPDEERARANIHLVKNRNGPLGRLQLAFDAECMAFTNQGPHLP